MSTITKFLSKPPDGFSTQIASATVAADALSVSLDSTTGIPTEGIGQFFKKDANGALVTGSVEFVHWTGVSGNTITFSDTGDRGITGSDSGAQSYVADDYFEVWVSSYYVGGYGGLIEHTATGAHKPTQIVDTNGNVVVKFEATASAVNEITVTNAATGNEPKISATGGDDNVGLKIASKGTKSINMSTGWYQAAQAYTPAGAGTTTLDLSKGNEHVVTMPANTQTLAISNGTVGQKFIVDINNVTSQGALTWFTTIRWAGGSAPTLTGTNGKRDSFGFKVTGDGTYDGFVVGQNI